MNRISLSPRGRIALFAVLVLVGLAYIVAFAWFKRHSVDLIVRDRDMSAALSVAEIESPTFAWTFEKGSGGLAMLGGGWQLPDSEAIWSGPKGGVIYLPVNVAAGSELEVHFDGHLNPPDKEMTVALMANGSLVSHWRLTHQHWRVVDSVTLPTGANEGVPWRLQFTIERPARALWRGYEPGLLAYGIHLRGIRTLDDASSERAPAE